MPDHSVDQRQHPRAPIDLRVDYKRLNSFFADYTKNISKGGTFIKTKNPLPVGTQFRFTLAIPKRTDPFELLGQVVRAGSDGEDDGMAIRFIYAGDAQRKEFEDAVESIMAGSLGRDLVQKMLEKP